MTAAAYLRRAARYQGVPYSRRAWLAILDAWETPAARPERTRT